eukprot:CAMPEP_0118967230 /NCGR_PEP_ID=MMETSP1173-20130426/4648_1 /TAXON_ID=1034831 /ORGANISM="Rhizochromulina marina cf, Strain CCMP1243" /LENGTH=48 /DNA_ID= /DNA_START= /DNA_END= /DNA_ORIENTATION=
MTCHPWSSVPRQISFGFGEDGQFGGEGGDASGVTAEQPGVPIVEATGG